MNRFFLSLFFAAILSPDGWCGPSDFDIEGPRQFPAGNYPEFLVTADFNDDGMDDLAVADRTGEAATILFGDTTGLGSFTLDSSYTVDSGPYGLSTGDFNDDGILDIATANRDSGSVSILIGNGLAGVGDGTFAPAVTYPAGGSCYSIAAGDFDGDDIADLAVVNDQGFDDLRILTGQGSAGVGDGTFSTPGPSIGVNEWPHMVIAEDVDENGILDLLVTHAHSESLIVMIGNGLAGAGDGTFQLPVNYFIGNGSHSVIAEDFNGDGILDLAASIWNTDYIAVLAGNGVGGVGDGTFQAMTPYAVPADPRRVVAGDWNGDTILDLATTAYDGMAVSVLPGVGDGTFLAAIEHDASGRAFSVESGDFDGDGNLDLVTLNPGMASALLFRGKGDGTVQAARAAPSGGNSSAGATGDFNGDGELDLVICDGALAEVRILTGAGNGTFTPADSAAIPKAGAALAVNDFNGDDILDVAVLHLLNGSYSILPGNGDGTLGLPVIDTVGSFPRHIVSGDWNGDGIADLAHTITFPPSLHVRLGNGSGGTGDGTFSLDSSYGAIGSPQYIDQGDYNSDGITDLALLSRTVDSVTIFLGDGAAGTGNGKFIESGRQGTGDTPSSLTSGDLDGDGILDLVTADEGGNTVSLLTGGGSLGVGDGTFAPPLLIALPGDSRHVTIADADGDMIPDLLVSLGNRGALAILQGVGGGAFSNAILYGTGRKAVQSVVGDFDGMAMPDIAVIGETTSRVRILLNNSTGIATAVGGNAPSASGILRLVNIPNPFNPTTVFPLQLAERTRVTLAIYSPNGRLVRLLADQVYPAGAHTLQWNGRDSAGHPLPSGLYLTRLRSDGRIRMGKALLIR